jgi:hypothetical protein
LKVAEAKQQKDAGRSIALMDSDTMKTLGVTISDVEQTHLHYIHASFLSAF